MKVAAVAIDTGLTTYPDEQIYAELREEIAKVYPGEPENIVLTDGGMGAIDLILSSINPTQVYVQQPTFQPIEHRVKFHGHNQKYHPGSVPVRIFINPNNPTGRLVNRFRLVDSLKFSDLTIVDEEYADYATWHVLSEYEVSENLMITRSFSKAYGLPSLRIGWITCGKRWAKYLRDVRYPWRIGRLACIAAIEAIKDQSFVKDVVKKTIETRGYVKQRLVDYNPIHSHANYVMLQVSDSDRAWTELLKRGFVVRNLKERIGTNAIRFMIHYPDVMKRFIDALLEVH